MKKGFSLIELMVTVVIIGILLGIISVNLASARVKGRDARRQADMEAIAAALEIYYAQNKSYPLTADWSALKDFTDPQGKKFSPTYISAWPEDPKKEKGSFPSAYLYYYQVKANAGMFVVDARLEGKTNCDSTLELKDSSKDNFYQTGFVCGDDGKNHYRVAGR